MPASRPWSSIDCEVAQHLRRTVAAGHRAVDEVGARQRQVVLGDALRDVREQAVGLVTEQTLDVHDCASLQDRSGNGSSSSTASGQPRPVRVYSTTAAICSGVRLSANDGHRPAAVGDDGFLVGGIGERLDDDAGERRSEAPAAVGSVTDAHTASRRSPGRCRRPRSAPASLSGGSFANNKITNDAVTIAVMTCTTRTSVVSQGTVAQKLGKPELSKNQNALVNHRPTSSEKTRPPTTGSAHPGMPRRAHAEHLRR